MTGGGEFQLLKSQIKRPCLGRNGREEKLHGFRLKKIKTGKRKLRDQGKRGKGKGKEGQKKKEKIVKEKLC